MSYNACADDLKYLKEDLPWLKEADSTALQSTLRDLDDSFKRFFPKQNGRPKFQKKQSDQSYTAKMNISIAGHNQLKLPKLGIVHCHISKIPSGRIMSATVRRTASGRYFVTLKVKEFVHTLPETGNSVGIDLGLKDLAILSDGTKYDSPHPLKQYEKKLAREQRKLSHMREIAKKQHRKLSDCRNYQKQRIKVARIHEKIANIRQDFLQKLTTELVRKYDVICIEDLNVAGMVKNHHLAKAVEDACFSELVRELQYKADWYGRTVQKVSRWYPSSQTCHVCGCVNPVMKDLSVREWTCPECGTHHDRDINAAINIKTEGLRLLSAV